jgi:hypothetical protein
MIYGSIRVLVLIGLLAIMPGLHGCEGAFSSLVVEQRIEPDVWEMRLSPQFLYQGDSNKEIMGRFQEIPEEIREKFLLNANSFITLRDFGPHVQVKRTTRDFETGDITWLITVPAETPSGEVKVKLEIVSGIDKFRGEGNFFVLFAPGQQ